MKWQHHTLLAYSAAACGNAIYGTLQGNKVLLGRFAKAYNNGRSQLGNRTKIPESPSTNRIEVFQLVNGEKDSTPTPAAFNTRNEPSELNASTSTSARATNVSQDALCDISEIDTRELNHSVLSYSENCTPSARKNCNSITSESAHCKTPVECIEGVQQSFAGDKASVNVVSEDCERDNIVIIDYIPNAVDFVNSSHILKEINNFAPTLSVKYAYSLARGGIAVHLNSQQDKQTLIQSLPREAFGGGKVYDLSTKIHSVFIKGVSSALTTSRIHEILACKDIEILQVKRLTQHRTGRPLPVVKVSCTYESYKKLYSLSAITINGVACRIERKHIEVYRCFNCHQFGHIARTCKLPTRCVNCAEHHSPNGVCRSQSKCANCSGPHRASSRNCPTYRHRYEVLTSQCSESEHVQGVVRTSHSETSTRCVVTSGGMAAQRGSVFQGLRGLINKD